MQIKKDRLIQEARHDTYRLRGKLPDPTLCSVCRACYMKGRWTWETPPAGAQETVCPACRRISENFPAGFVEVAGEFYKTHREEIHNLIENIQKRVMERRPLERIIAKKETLRGLVVTTTGVRIARLIGESLGRAYQGELQFKYGQGAKQIRVIWER